MIKQLFSSIFKYSNLARRSDHDFDIKVLRIPPPFKKIVAINSDVEFTTWPAQLDLMRFFAKKNLETAFSFWLFCDPTWTWRIFNEDLSPSQQAHAAFQLIDRGALDTLHSFGGILHGKGIDFDRSMISKAYKFLEKEGIRIRVYSNHGTTKDTQNIGGFWTGELGSKGEYISYQQGDVPNDRRYHLDLTLEHGVKFFWLDVDLIQHISSFSMRTTVEDDAEGLFVPQISRDGNSILRFRRTNTNIAPDAVNLGAQIDNVLDDDNGEISIIYTHLGVKRTDDGRPLCNQAPYFTSATYRSIDRLVKAQNAGDVLVTTTYRALNYALLISTKPWEISIEDRRIIIKFFDKIIVDGISFNLEWEDLNGFCFITNTFEPPIAILRGKRRELATWELNGIKYAGFRWSHNNFLDVINESFRYAQI